MKTIEKKTAQESTVSNEAEAITKASKSFDLSKLEKAMIANPSLIPNVVALVALHGGQAQSKETIKAAGVEISLELLCKALNDAKSLGGDLQQLAEKANLGRSIETMNGGKIKVPTPAVLNDLASLGLLGPDKAKAKAKCDKVKALLSVLRGLEGLGVIKR